LMKFTVSAAGTHNEEDMCGIKHDNLS